MKLLHITLFLFLGLLWACEKDTTTSEESTTVTETKQDLPKATLVDMSPSPDFPSASIDDYKYENGTFTFDISGDYELGIQTEDADSKMCANSAKGQHIHLIIDNEPYTAHYTNTFDYTLEDGTYDMLAFLSRSYHESIKTPSAYVAHKITVEDGSITNKEPITRPALFYSRPKGNYIGKDADLVMLDYYVINGEVGQDLVVEAEINGGQKLQFHTWKPKLLKGLPMGENNIKLTLLDKSGNLASSPIAPVTRKFTLREDKLEE